MSRPANPPSSRRRLLFIGNPGRGDDGVAVALMEQLMGSPRWQRYASQIDAEWYFQLCPEQVYELANTTAVLFIDADASTDGSVILEPVQPAERCIVSSHSLEPSTLLRLYEDVFQCPPPSAGLLRIPGEHFELSDTLSALARDNMDRALHQLFAWLEAPSSAPCAGSPAAASATTS